MTRRDWLRFRYEILVILVCWRTNGFESFELFRRKYRKHALRDFGTNSEIVYLWKADKLWRGESYRANHLGPPTGTPEECVREEDYSFIRYNHLSYEIGFLMRNRGSCLPSDPF